MEIFTLGRCRGCFMSHGRWKIHDAIKLHFCAFHHWWGCCAYSPVSGSTFLEQENLHVVPKTSALFRILTLSRPCLNQRHLCSLGRGPAGDQVAGVRLKEWSRMKENTWRVRLWGWLMFDHMGKLKGSECFFKRRATVTLKIDNSSQRVRRVERTSFFSRTLIKIDKKNVIWKPASDFFLLSVSFASMNQCTVNNNWVFLRAALHFKRHLLF